MCEKGFHLLDGQCIVRLLSPPGGTEGGLGELVNLAAIVEEKSASGKLDTGYPVSSVVMLKPKPRPEPTAQGGSNATDVHETQRIVLTTSGANEISADALVFLTFNGATTAQGLEVARLINAMRSNASESSDNSDNSVSDVALQVQAALEGLDTISKVGVAPSYRDIEGASELIIDVSFHHGQLVPSPLNLGPLPCMTISVQGDVSESQTVQASVEVVRRGQPPVNYSFPEQMIEFNATDEDLAALSGGIRLSFRDQTTDVLPLNASATEMRLKLMVLESMKTKQGLQPGPPLA